MHVVGLVLHPERDCGGAVASVLDWADQRGIEVLGIDSELSRLACSANPVSVEELRQRADLLVSMGGDGTMLRAMRLADRQRFPVLGVNLGKLGFLAEVDVPELPDALSAIDEHSYTTEPRLAVDAVIGEQVITAFNDVAFVRFPGHKTAAVAVRAAGQRFVSYAADAIVVATPTGSTAYSFSAGGPIVSPGVEALVVTPVAPHSAYNRGLVISCEDQLGLDILPGSGKLAVEADGIAATDVRARRPDRADPAARRRPRGPPRPHHVLPAGPAQAAAGRLRGAPRHLRGRGGAGRACRRHPRLTCTATTTACCARTGGAPRRTRPGTCWVTCSPACACSTSAAVRARSPRTWPRGCPTARSPGSTRRPACWPRPGPKPAAGAWPTSGSRPATCTGWRSRTARSTWCTRTRCCSTCPTRSPR